MSRDRRGNGIQEVVGSIPISSTKSSDCRSKRVGVVVYGTLSRRERKGEDVSPPLIRIASEVLTAW